MIDAETRRNAAIALSKVCCSVGLSKEILPEKVEENGDGEQESVEEQGDSKKTESEDDAECSGLSLEQYRDVLRSVAAQMDDYATDNRGDIGSWVREAAIHSTRELLDLVCQRSDDGGAGAELFLTEGLVSLLMNKLLRQMAEKLDKLRACAASVLLHILRDNNNGGGDDHTTIQVPFVPHRKELELIFTEVNERPPLPYMQTQNLPPIPRSTSTHLRTHNSLLAPSIGYPTPGMYSLCCLVPCPYQVTVNLSSVACRRVVEVSLAHF